MLSLRLDHEPDSTSDDILEEIKASKMDHSTALDIINALPFHPLRLKLLVGICMQIAPSEDPETLEATLEAYYMMEDPVERREFIRDFIGK